MSDSSWPHGLQPARLLCPWNSPGKNTGVGSCSLLQGIFLTQGLKPQTGVSCIAGIFFTIWATREALRVQWIPSNCNPECPFRRKRFNTFPSASVLHVNYSPIQQWVYSNKLKTGGKVCGLLPWMKVLIVFSNFLCTLRKQKQKQKQRKKVSSLPNNAGLPWNEAQMSIIPGTLWVKVML